MLHHRVGRRLLEKSFLGGRLSFHFRYLNKLYINITYKNKTMYLVPVNENERIYDIYIYIYVYCTAIRSKTTEPTHKR